MAQETLLFSASDARRYLEPTACVDAVEEAFRQLGRGLARAPAVASVHVDNGVFHVKAGVLDTADGTYFVAKTNANFPDNPTRRHLPTIQGTLVLHDAESGRPLALLDSGEITAARTAAATAVAVRHLAREDATTLAIIGCGLQGERHARLLPLVRPIRRIVFCDRDQAAAQTLARRMDGELRIPATVARSPADAVQGADVVVTCTTSTDFLLSAGDVSRGTFVAGVGVDNEHKRELAPDLLARCSVFADLIVQCAVMGDLHHALDAGVMSIGDVRAELGNVVAGRHSGRQSPDETIVFDSTGMALQDVAAAVLVYQSALAGGTVPTIDFRA